MFLQTSLSSTMESYRDTKIAKKVFNEIQRNFHCCGNSLYKDWFYIDWHHDSYFSSLSKISGNNNATVYSQVSLLMMGSTQNESIINSIALA